MQYTQVSDSEISGREVTASGTIIVGVIRGDTRTDYSNGAAILDDDGNETGEFEQIENMVDLWQEAIDAGAVMLTDAYKAATAKSDARRAAKQTRDEALANLTYTFADGRTIQTREQDKWLIDGGIRRGGGNWILANNTAGWVTADELQEASDATGDVVAQIFELYATSGGVV